MYTSPFIDYKVASKIFYILYAAQDISGEISPSLLGILLFGIIWNSKDQNNEFDKPEKKTVQHDLLKS